MQPLCSKYSVKKLKQIQAWEAESALPTKAFRDRSNGKKKLQCAGILGMHSQRKIICSSFKCSATAKYIMTHALIGIYGNHKMIIVDMTETGS